MMTVLILITVTALLLPVYVYLGYPLLLIVLDTLVSGKKVNRAPITPTLTMVVSCYNEIDIIEQKIKNCLELDYPQQLIEFIFVSDGSDDGTDEAIKQHECGNIKLIRQEGRLGKTMGLNLALAAARGEIIVFSDANAMYRTDALKMLARNFHDPSIGYVVGAALYVDGGESASGANENAYWQYEIFMKNIESRLHSVVGGDGAIYAIRKSLYRTLNSNDINDFVNPLQIILQGYRGIFDEQAICYEQTAGDFDKEGKRKQRIVNRSFTGLMNNKAVLNPFKVGFYAVEIWSHKLLRWLIPFFLLIAAFGIVILAQFEMVVFQVLLLFGILFSWLIMLGYCLKGSGSCPGVLLIPYYFYLVNYNSLLGILQSIKGEVQVTWSTPRATQSTGAALSIKSLIVFTLLALFSVALFVNTWSRIG